MDKFCVLRCDACRKLRCGNRWATEKYGARCKCFCRKSWGVNLKGVPRAKKVLILYWYLRHTIYINPGWRWYLHPLEIAVNLSRFFVAMMRGKEAAA